jgi:hypothetical protein
VGRLAGVLRVLVQLALELIDALDQLRHRGLQLLDALLQALHVLAYRLGGDQSIRLVEGMFDGHA